MKRLLLLLFTIFTIVATSAQEIINNPDFLGTNTHDIKVVKIEVRDNETILHVLVTIPLNARLRIPLGTMIQDAKSGKTFKLIKSSGIPINKFTSMQNGTGMFRLYFEPLDNTTTKIDYVEGYSVDDYVIYGMPVKNNIHKSTYRTSQYKYDEDTNILTIKYDVVNSITIPTDILSNGNKNMTVRIVKYLD